MLSHPMGVLSMFSSPYFRSLEGSIYGRLAGNKRLEFSQRAYLTYNLLFSRSTTEGTRKAS
jgi:hypothetical protein